eukprot:1210912-Amphidinium_carterae.1
MGHPGLWQHKVSNMSTPIERILYSLIVGRGDHNQNARVMLRHFTYVSEFVASELSGQYRVCSCCACGCAPQLSQGWTFGPQTVWAFSHGAARTRPLTPGTKSEASGLVTSTLQVVAQSGAQ